MLVPCRGSRKGCIQWTWTCEARHFEIQVQCPHLKDRLKIKALASWPALLHANTEVVCPDRVPLIQARQSSLSDPIVFESVATGTDRPGINQEDHKPESQRAASPDNFPRDISRESCICAVALYLVGSNGPPDKQAGSSPRVGSSNLACIRWAHMSLGAEGMYYGKLEAG